MKITFIWIGKTSESWLQEGIAIYEKRLKHYISFSIEVIVLKSMPKHDVERQKVLEGEAVLDRIDPSDDLYLLDEWGTMYSSEGLASFFQKKMSLSIKNLVFVIGGPYGFSQKVYQRANGQISFSKLTFSHQMIRLLLCEQIYRAFTIIKGESYHHS